MADEQTPEEEQQPKKAKGFMIIGAVVAMLAGGAGFMVPLMAPQLFSSDATASEQKAAPPTELDPEDVAFLEFGEVIVNLNMDRFNRYLKLKVTLEVAKEKSVDIEKRIEDRTAVLRGWLIAHVADKTMDEIRGASGQNKLRREIHDQFNAILTTDGYDVVNDIYFEEFNVQ